MKKRFWKSNWFVGLAIPLFSLFANNRTFSQSGMQKFVELLASIVKPRIDYPVLVEKFLSGISDQFYPSQSFPSATQPFKLIPKNIKNYLGRHIISTQLDVVPLS